MRMLTGSEISQKPMQNYPHKDSLDGVYIGVVQYVHSGVHYTLEKSGGKSYERQKTIRSDFLCMVGQPCGCASDMVEMQQSVEYRMGKKRVQGVVWERSEVTKETMQIEM